MNRIFRSRFGYRKLSYAKTVFSLLILAGTKKNDLTLVASLPFSGELTGGIRIVLLFPSEQINAMVIIMDINLTSKYSCYRSIDQNEIYSCVTANKERDVTSLWGKIVDWFIGTKKEAAKVALFRLAHADKAVQQLSSFAELRQYVAPAWQDSLTWQFRGNDDCVFKIGDFDIPFHSTVSEATTERHPELNPEDICSLLCSMKYTDYDVISEFHLFAVGSLSDRNADSVLTKQEMFLKQNPSLLGALNIIGLNQNDPKGDFAYNIAQKVERMVYKITGDEDKSALAARNAENLSILASNLSP